MGFRVRFGFIKLITRNPFGSEEKARNPTRPALFRSLGIWYLLNEGMSPQITDLAPRPDGCTVSSAYLGPGTVSSLEEPNGWQGERSLPLGV